MFFMNKKKKNLKNLEKLYAQIEIFIQVHYVREQHYERRSLNTLTQKDNPKHIQLCEWLEENGNPKTFSQLCLLFLKRLGKDESEVCITADLDKNYFSLLSSESYIPSKYDAVKICMGLKLNFEETKLLLQSANYSLKNSSKEDLIIRYFIENEYYDVHTLNEALNHLCENSLSNIIQ